MLQPQDVVSVLALERPQAFFCELGPRVWRGRFDLATPHSCQLGNFRRIAGVASPGGFSTTSVRRPSRRPYRIV